MANKKFEPVAGRPSKVRFVMIEAEINQNDSLSDLTAAIVQAVRQQAPSGSRPLPATPRGTQAALESPQGSFEEEPTEELAESDELEDEITVTPKNPRPKPKMPVPDYVHDLFANGKDAEFKTFADSKAPGSNLKRYLVAALWLRDHGDSPTVDINKMYTSYRTAGWPVGISDWDSNFRGLVKADKLRRTATGEYAITPLGEADIQKI